MGFRLVVISMTYAPLLPHQEHIKI